MLHHWRRARQSLSPARGSVPDLADHCLNTTVARIAIAGDVGHPSAARDATVALLVAQHRRRRFDALVLLGDNVYPDGDPDTVPSAVLDPFAPLLHDGVVLLAALGNHDVERGRGDEVAVRLGMPGRWYEQQIGPVRLVVFDSTRPDDADQWAWLEATLARHTPGLTVLALHHPPYSAGWHGSSRALREALRPLLRHHGVSLVLAGHEHDYQRSHRLDGTTYVVSGATTYLRPTGRAAFTAAAAARHHVLDLRALPDRAVLLARGHDGQVFDGCALPYRRDGGAPGTSAGDPADRTAELLAALAYPV